SRDWLALPQWDRSRRRHPLDLEDHNEKAFDRLLVIRGMPTRVRKRCGLLSQHSQSEHVQVGKFFRALDSPKTGGGQGGYRSLAKRKVIDLRDRNNDDHISVFGRTQSGV